MKPTSLVQTKATGVVCQIINGKLGHFHNYFFVFFKYKTAKILQELGFKHRVAGYQ